MNPYPTLETHVLPERSKGKKRGEFAKPLVDIADYYVGSLIARYSYTWIALAPALLEFTFTVCIVEVVVFFKRSKMSPKNRTLTGRSCLLSIFYLLVFSASLHDTLPSLELLLSSKA